MRTPIRPALAAVTFVYLMGAGRTASARIDNGLAADPGQFPYVVRLLGADPGRDCTGTIIGPNAVLTAAHCVAGLDPKNPQLSIHLPDGRVVAAAQFLAHPGSDSRRIEGAAFSANESADALKSHGLEYLRLVKSELALVKPDPSVQFTQWAEVDPAPTAPGQPVTLAGYGMNDKLEHSGNGPLRYGTNQLEWESQGVLFVAGRYMNNVDREGNVKGDGQQVSPDRGDSGGPLFSNRGLIGVVVASQEPELSDAGAYLTIDKAIGAATGHSLLRGDSLLWCFYAAVNDDENRAFLTKTATEQGYQIVWAGQSAPVAAAAPSAASAPVAAPKPRTSPTLDALQNGGGFGP